MPGHLEATINITVDTDVEGIRLHNTLVEELFGATPDPHVVAQQFLDSTRLILIQLISIKTGLGFQESVDFLAANSSNIS